MKNKMSNSETEINRIREALYNEERLLTVQQRVEKGNKLAREVAEKYGLTLIANTRQGEVLRQN